jgi:hypothetical protein
MKKGLIAFLCLPLFGNLYSQIDTSAASFFPSAIGDAWHYQDTPITTLTGDSIAGGWRYLFFDSSSVPLYKIDSMWNVVIFPTQPSYTSLLYKLLAGRGETWIYYSNPGLRIVARVEDVFWGFVLGHLTQIKRIGYYYQPGSDTTFTLWQRDDYIASGFGFYLQITEGSPTASVWLVGCIIDGITYGTMTSVQENATPLISSSYKLYPAFPNPFNPSTTISYSLPQSGQVNVSVYDLLGRTVVNLVDEFQGKGSHSVLFEPQNLPSGVYFVKLTARNFTATNKIVYAR